MCIDRILGCMTTNRSIILLDSFTSATQDTLSFWRFRRQYFSNLETPEVRAGAVRGVNFGEYSQIPSLSVSEVYSHSQVWHCRQNFSSYGLTFLSIITYFPDRKKKLCLQNLTWPRVALTVCHFTRIQKSALFFRINLPLCETVVSMLPARSCCSSCFLVKALQ